MNPFSRKLAVGVFAVMFWAAPHLAQGQAQSSKYSNMAPIEQYFMARDAEIALARSAAPESISRDADILVMERHAYEIAAKGKNGFTCLVQRSWTAPSDDPEFWNPRLRAPICYNPQASRSYVPRILKKTELALAGRSKQQIAAAIATALDTKQLPAVESGSMCYMLSKDGYLGDRFGHWHPHLMFFVPETETAAWGANLPHSPILGATDKQEHLTVFLIPLGQWSDGTPGPPMHDSDSNLGQP